MSILAYMHTPPQRLTPQWQEEPSRTLHYAGLTIFCSPLCTGFTWFSLPRMHSPLHARAEHSCTSNSHFPFCLFTHARAGSCSSSRVNQCLFIILTHRNFLVFRLMQRAESHAIPSTNYCEGPFMFLAVSQTGMVVLFISRTGLGILHFSLPRRGLWSRDGGLVLLEKLGDWKPHGQS